jgi:hypothetical protein
MPEHGAPLYPPTFCMHVLFQMRKSGNKKMNKISFYYATSYSHETLKPLALENTVLTQCIKYG